MINKECTEFAEFCESHGDAVAVNVLERICEAIHGQCAGVTIDVKHQHNALNYTCSGEIAHNSQVYRFIVEDGDWNGTVICEWGTEETVGLYQPPEPTRYTMIPADSRVNKWDRPGLWRVYKAWRKETWFHDLLRKYLYDRHFAPGCRTEGHYRPLMAANGLKLATEEEFTELENMPEPGIAIEELQELWPAT